MFSRKTDVVLYSFDGDGGGSTLIHNWVLHPRILKDKNKKRSLMESKKQNYLK